MSHDIPYIMAPGKIEIALQGIKKASVPPKVTQDFVKQVLGIKGGTGDQVTTYLKKLAFRPVTELQLKHIKISQ